MVNKKFVVESSVSKPGFFSRLFAKKIKPSIESIKIENKFNNANMQDSLRLEIDSLEKIITNKMESLDKYLNKNDVKSFLIKRKIGNQIAYLKDKLHQKRLELSKLVVKDTSSTVIVKKDKDEIKNELLAEIAKAKEDLENTKKKLHEEVSKKLADFHNKEIFEKKEKHQSLLNKLAQVKSELNEVKKNLDEKTKQKIVLQKEAKEEVSTASSKPSLLPPKILSKSTPLPQIPLFETSKSDDFSRLIIKQGVSDSNEFNFPSMPKLNLNNLSFEKMKPKLSKPIVKKIRKLSKNKFFLLEEFNAVYADIDRIKYKIDNFEHFIKRSHTVRTNEQDLISSSLANSEMALESLSKINSCLYRAVKF